ncbi:MAG: hypothetical protein MHMPM18_004106 [Marteilia pararefringens]
MSMQKLRKKIKGLHSDCLRLKHQIDSTKQVENEYNKIRSQLSLGVGLVSDPSLLVKINKADYEISKRLKEITTSIAAINRKNETSLDKMSFIRKFIMYTHSLMNQNSVCEILNAIDISKNLSTDRHNANNCNLKSLNLSNIDNFDLSSDPNNLLEMNRTILAVKENNNFEIKKKATLESIIEYKITTQRENVPPEDTSGEHIRVTIEKKSNPEKVSAKKTRKAKNEGKEKMREICDVFDQKAPGFDDHERIKKKESKKACKRKAVDSFKVKEHDYFSNYNDLFDFNDD